MADVTTKRHTSAGLTKEGLLVMNQSYESDDDDDDLDMISDPEDHKQEATERNWTGSSGVVGKHHRKEWLYNIYAWNATQF